MNFVMSRRSFGMHRKDSYDDLDFQFGWFAQTLPPLSVPFGIPWRSFTPWLCLPFPQLLISQAPGWYLHFEKSPGDSFSVSSQKFTLIFIFKNCASNLEWVHSCEEYSRVCRAIWEKPPSHPPLTLTALLRSTRSLISHLPVGCVCVYSLLCAWACT